MNLVTQTAFSLTVDENAIGWVTIDVHGESQNTLKSEFAEAFHQLLDEINQNDIIKALVIISGKSSSFISGADISMLEAVNTAEEAEALALKGHDIFNRLECLELPVIAAIHGACLGGGLELALACSHRIGTDDRVTKIGLPEVQLGVLPGGGGTQRLPRLIGIAAALDLMLTGRQLNAKRAERVGILDEVVSLANLRKAAAKLAARKVGSLRPKASEMSFKFSIKSLFNRAVLQRLVLETTQKGRDLLFRKASEKIMQKTHGNYPAPHKIIECVSVGMACGFAKGLATEAKLFGELVVSPEAEQLMYLFYASNQLKKDTGVMNKEDTNIKVSSVKRVGVLGGGLMGAGIAFVTADKAGKRVRIKEVSIEGVNHALKYCWAIYRKHIKRKRTSLNDASKRFAAISGTIDYSGFKQVDIVIEAVFEKLELKQQMVKEIEAVAKPEFIFASNTSSIPIAQIAKASFRPERVIGMHYFSPVEKMPLLEVVVTDKTSDEVIKTCVELGKQQGKTVIVVKDGCGFYTSRVLGPFVNEAGHLLMEGVAIDRIDSVMVNAGFPVGPFRLLDEVGIDVGAKISAILVEAFGDRMLPPSVFSKLGADNRQGKKNKRGFYHYTSQKKGVKPVDKQVYTLLGVSPNNMMNEDNIVTRCLLQMVNEAVMCLEEGILRSPLDGDIGAIFGLGFPPFLGGPFRYVDSLGPQVIVERLEALEKIHGVRFKPASLLKEKALAATRFH